MKITFKAILISLLAACMLALPSCQYDDAPLKDRIDILEQNYEDLKAEVEAINGNIGALKAAVNALENKVTISEVAKIEKDGKVIGFNITFSDGGHYTIETGADGHSPAIGVKQDADKLYYWTLDGEFLLDEAGQKIPATAHIATPKIRVNSDNNFEISYNNGETWEMIGPAGKEPIFREVTDNESEVIFTLADGVTTITIPKTPKFRIVVAQNQLAVAPNGSITTEFKVEGADDKTMVEAIGTDGFSAKVLGSNPDYFVNIKAPATIDGKVFIFAVNAHGATAACILRLEEGKLTVDNSKIKKVKAEGGEVTIPFMTNLPWTVSVDPGNQWIKEKPATKAMTKEFVTFTVDANPNETGRSGKVFINPEGGLDVIELTIEQYGTADVVPTGGGSFDLDTFNGGNSGADKNIYTSTNGWITNEHVSLLSNTVYNLPSSIAPALIGSYRGSTGAQARRNKIGVITSPMLTGGLGQMQIQFAAKVMSGKANLKIEIKNESGEIVGTKEFNRTDLSYTETGKLNFTTETIDFNIPGKFQIVLTNTNKTSDFNEVVITKLEWTECL